MIEGGDLVVRNIRLRRGVCRNRVALENHLSLALAVAGLIHTH